ncbi:hypothetical protein BN1723_015165 [Verticillium longisporum]|uniref:Malate dehydrogenase n=1 Tax=Verticillium longisporum TaxID=100787 RepID=A0A0G4MS12_VERLO|nr:hypothetical protein BN1723_015165 [Verticillium longisporum]
MAAQEEAPGSTKIFVEAKEATRFVEAILSGNGVPAENAAIVAKYLVAADLRGVDTHGINRIPSYMERIRQGVLNPAAQPQLCQVTPVVAHVDGQNGFGFIYKAKRRGEKIPLDWALDAEGRPTDDPEAALGGVMLPMGGPKGSALSIMMDVFSGALSGSAFAGGVTNPYDPSKPADVGHFLMAIKPDLFMSLEDFRARMQHLYDRVVGSEKAAGVERIYFPGEIEQLTQEERGKTGIPFVGAEIEALNEEAARVGAELMVTET